MKERLLTVALLGAAFVLHIVVSPPDDARAIAEQLIGPADPLDFPGLPSFQSGDRTVLFFEGTGMRSQIEGVLVIEGENIQQLRLLKAKEGLHFDELTSGAFIDSFRGKRAQAPVVVQSVSGATISSQALLDAVNVRLAEWLRWRDGKGNRP